MDNLFLQIMQIRSELSFIGYGADDFIVTIQKEELVAFAISEDEKVQLRLMEII